MREVEMTARAVNVDGGFEEVRLADAEGTSHAVLRGEGATEGIERGATYTMRLTKKQGVPAEATVTATVPASDAGSLPASAEVSGTKKGGK